MNNSGRGIARYVALASIALSLAACGSGNNAELSERTASSPSGLTHSVQAAFVIDPYDLSQLAGFADNVFTGTVIEQSGEVSGGTSLPETQFTVSVDEVLKGSLGGEVIVNQQGGVDPTTGDTVLLEDDPLLEPGKSYVFATRLNAEYGWHTVIAGNGHMEIGGTGEQNSQARRATAPDVVEEMRRAVANPTPYEEPAGVDPGQGPQVGIPVPTEVEPGSASPTEITQSASPSPTTSPAAPR